MSYARIIFQNVACVLIAGILSYYSSSAIGALYCGAIGNCSAGLASVNFSPVVGLLLGYFFFVPLLLVSFGSRGKNWWIALLTFPILAWAVYMDIRLMELIPVILSAAVGVFVGMLAHKTLINLAPSFIAKVR